MAQYEGTIKQDTANIDNAKLQLTYAKVTAPITGVVGLRLVDPGNIVHASDANGMVVITQLQPISVLFTIPEDNLPQVIQKLRAGAHLTVDAYNRDNSKKIASGTLVTLDNQIDNTTGTSKLKAVFDNTDNALFPQQFVNIRLLVDTLANQLIVPNVAIQNGQQGTFVYVVDDDSKVHLKPVQVGITTETSIADSRRPYGRGAGGRRWHRPPGRRRRGCACAKPGNSRIRPDSIPPRRGGGRPRQGGAAESAGRRRRQFQKGPGRRRFPVSPSRIFILRPVATSLMMAGVVLVGFVAFRQLPVSALPQVDYPTMQIQTFYPGRESGGGDVVDHRAARKAVRAGARADADDVDQLLWQFADHAAVFARSQHRRRRAGGAGGHQRRHDVCFRRIFPVPPVYSKTNPADAPILTLALTSSTVPLPKVEELAETRMAQRISQLKGVGLVSISGGQRPAVRVQANPTALASYGLSLETLRTALASANVNQAKGQFRRTGASLDHQRQRPACRPARNTGPIIIAYRNGAPVRISDVATVVDGVENTKLAAWVNADRAIVLNIQRQPGTNIISVVDTVQALLPQIKASLPQGINVQVISDRTTTIRASVKDVEFELMLTTALVVMVIFLFLRSASATIIPGIAVPLSLVGTFAVMYLLGYSLDNLSLMALTISTGFVVDDAIVMIENISRYLEMGDIADGSRAQRLGGDRLHHRLADRFADRRADSAAVHGRHRRPPVPRIRRDAGGDDHLLGVRVADADAHDGGPDSEAPPGIGAGPPVPLVGVVLRQDHRVVRQDGAAWCCAISR